MSPTPKCWGCGAPDGRPPCFKSCTLCREEGISPPCTFCSTECAAAFPTHVLPSFCLTAMLIQPRFGERHFNRGRSIIIGCRCLKSSWTRHKQWHKARRDVAQELAEQESAAWGGVGERLRWLVSVESPQWRSVHLLTASRVTGAAHAPNG